MAASFSAWAGGTGDWFTAGNWTPAVVPTAGYTVNISSGTAIVSSGSPAVEGISILLGGLATGEPVTLQADNAVFQGQGTPPSEINMTIQVVGGNPFLSPLDATFLIKGTTTYDGQILVEAQGGRLTIRSESDGTTAGNFVFSNADEKAVMVVEQESVLAFSGNAITNGGLIEVRGGVDVEAGVTLKGDGIVVLEDGGNANVWGKVGRGQRFEFADETGLLTLRNLQGFKGTIGFTEEGGARIDLAGLNVQSVSVDSLTQRLILYSEAGQQGTVIGSIAIGSIDANRLEPVSFDLETDDFVLGSDGSGGTMLTYQPANGINLQQSLPTAIVAEAGTSVTLASILQNSFGTADPGFTSITLLPSDPFENSNTNKGYWDTPNITPKWYLNGQQVTQATLITASQIDEVTLVVGNQINNPARFKALVTTAASGPNSETITYNAWSVDPRIVGAVHELGFTGLPTPEAIVASAVAFSQIFGQVLNNNLCNWIADNVAAGAGASMPLPDDALDPMLNAEGGFWRIAYSSDQEPTPVSNWGALVRPGDIVRMGWFKPESGAQSGHTTTVLGAVNASGGITVYDNIDDVTVDGNAFEYIGIHQDVQYWLKTNPADITIYRLDPDQQYLIQGTSLRETIAGSVFNDLIHPGGGHDVVRGGPGNDEIQDTTANLDGITVTDFSLGDRLDFTDLDPTRATLSFKKGVLTVSDGTNDATVYVAGSSQQVFVLTPDGTGGSFVERLDKDTLTGNHPSGYAMGPSVGMLTIAPGAFVGGSGVETSSAHASIVANLGQVQAAANATGVRMRAGGVLTNGTAGSSTGSIFGGIGVAVNGFGVVKNYGVIGSSTGGVALSFNSADSRLIEYATGQLIGRVEGGGGTLELARSAVHGTLAGLGQQIRGFATIQVDAKASWTLASGSVLAAGATLVNAGELALAGRMASSGLIENEAGGRLDLQGDFGIGKIGRIVNDGVLVKSTGTGISSVQASGGFYSSGKIVVQTGTLQLSGSLLGIAGTISGAGTIAFGHGITNLWSGAKVSTAGLSIGGQNATLVVQDGLGYDGAFSSSGGSVLRTNSEAHLALRGASTFRNSAVEGFGRLTTLGQTLVHGVVLGQYVQWENGGALLQTGTMSFGSVTSSFNNRAGAVFTLQGKVDVASPTQENVFRNEGTLIKTGGGNSTISATFANNGVVEISGGRLTLTGEIRGHGTLEFDGGQTLAIEGPVSRNQTVAFSAGKETLILGDATMFSGQLSDFGTNDRLDLLGFDPASTTLSFSENAAGTQGRLTISDATHQARITLLGQYAAAGFHAASDGSGGTLVTYTPPPETTQQLATVAAAQL